jgi:hypothetical protein
VEPGTRDQIMKKTMMAAIVLGLSLLGTAVASPVDAAEASAARATSKGCTFTPPTPSISGRKASFTVRVSCGSSRTGRRQVVWDLMGDDPVGDDVMGWAVGRADGSGTYSWSNRNWGCNEDLGGDELYVRVRVEDYYPGVGWIRGGWVKGSVRSGSC